MTSRSFDGSLSEMDGPRAIFCILLASFAGAAAASDCTPPVAGRIRQLNFEVVRDTSVARGVDLPADTSILVEAFESGINTRLEVQEPGQPLRVADGPVNRWGVRRILLAPAASRRIEVAIVGLERARGTAAVSIYRIDPRADGRCVEFWKAMAATDAIYARAEMITSGAVSAPEGAADHGLSEAARGYATAARVGRRFGGRWVAQAQLAYANTLLIGTERWQAAAAESVEAEKLFAALGDEYGQDRARQLWARTLMQRARHMEAGTESQRLFDRARATFVSIADNHKRRGERYDYAFGLTWVGFIDINTDRYLEAIAQYRSALAALEGLDEPARAVQIAHNLALAEFSLGRYQHALKNFRDALHGADPATEPEMYGYILKNVALAEKTLGHYDSALRRYSEGLAFARRIHNPRQEGFALDGIGSTYQAIGNFTEALAYLNRALELRSAERAPVERGLTLRSIADVQGEIGRGREAVANREEALRLARSPLSRARVKVELVRDRVDIGDFATAKTELELLMASSDVVDPAIHAFANLEASRIALIEGRLDAAMRDARAAADRFREQELVVKEFEAVLVQARVACARGRRGEALVLADRALQLAEEVRVFSNNPSLRASLWRPLRPAFSFSIGLHARGGACGGTASADPIAALAIAERSRSRALDDFRRGFAGEADLQRPDNVGRRELFEQVAARRQQIETLSETVPQSDARLRILRDEIARLRREIDLAGGQASPVRADSEDMLPSLRASIAAIPAGTAVVEYWLGENDAFAWLLTRGRAQLVELGPALRIEAAARALHVAMQKWTTISAPERLRRANDLHKLIIATLPADFARTRTTYFIPDGELHSVPFAALASDTSAQPRFLVDTHDIGVAPAFLGIGEGFAPRPLGRRPSALIVADPVYTVSDPRLDKSAAAATNHTDMRPTLRGARSWSRLPATAREAEAIAKLLGSGSVQLMSGFAASRDSLLERELDQYDILHFAVHAIADTEAPQLSALILSTYDSDGKSRIGEVFAGDLLDKRMSASIVVMSGCETALGQASAGEGLLGMRYAAHAAGARTVVASLWPVLDATGAQLMHDFYTGVIQRQQTPVAALSRAMRSARRQWSDPALWGAFDVSVSGL
ncbi:MAG: CHAT domain-containing protein [Steroidobacteraceae bacterium]|nr:CHAT domain-containing protein [Steroidobacteraceae bacterium]